MSRVYKSTPPPQKKRVITLFLFQIDKSNGTNTCNFFTKMICKPYYKACPLAYAPFIIMKAIIDTRKQVIGILSSLSTHSHLYQLYKRRCFKKFYCCCDIDSL
mmetsp:Transcript_29347/g.44367  ORF Transcript_29347/g.44367 Transcript_29347/m.44367 type:complete len:103 (+) Transcript_29347:894-1202(+)